MDSIGGFLRIMIAKKSRYGQKLCYVADTDSNFAVGSSIQYLCSNLGVSFCG